MIRRFAIDVVAAIPALFVAIVLIVGILETPLLYAVCKDKH